MKTEKKDTYADVLREKYFRLFNVKHLLNIRSVNTSAQKVHTCSANTKVEKGGHMSGLYFIKQGRLWSRLH